MVVMVVINRKALCVLAEKLDESGIAADVFRVPGAADVAIQANHLVGGAHHQVQIVGNHQHAATVTVAQTRDQAVQVGLTRHIDALHRFIEHQ